MNKKVRRDSKQTYIEGSINVAEAIHNLEYTVLSEIYFTNEGIL